LCSNAVYDKDNCILPFIYPEQLPGAKRNWDGMGSLNGRTKNNYYEKTGHLYKDLDETNSKFITCNVETIRLDTFCKNNNIEQVDLMMIDVEGVPLKILQSYGEKIKNI
jgi:FkbM family methyltransferase